MRFGSVCSGVEAASLAWEQLGWQPAFFSEIEKFPSAVLQHHYPNVPNLGDMTSADFADRCADQGPIDLLVGGTPCQSFSVAGLRGGLDDERGNLALEFCRLADRLAPRWIVWENVPGVLSSGGGRDFGSIVGAMVELGYNVAWRILDAQNFGVPQRRRRVFLVGHLGAERRGAAAVLFERESLSGTIKALRSGRLRGRGKRCIGTLGTRTGQYDRCELDRLIYNYEEKTVRTLTPKECERLQGMPDDWTKIPWRKKAAEDCPDGPRYKAIGNSMCVNVMKWLGERIDKVDEVLT